MNAEIPSLPATIKGLLNLILVIVCGFLLVMMLGLMVAYNILDYRAPVVGWPIEVALNAKYAGWVVLGNVSLCCAILFWVGFSMFKVVNPVEFLRFKFRYRLSTLLACMLLAGFLMWQNFTPRIAAIYMEKPRTYGWPWPGYVAEWTVDVVFALAAVYGLAYALERFHSWRKQEP